MEKNLEKNIYMYTYMYIYTYIHNWIFAVHLKLTQHCKLTKLQFLKNGYWRKKEFKMVTSREQEIWKLAAMPEYLHVNKCNKTSQQPTSSPRTKPAFPQSWNSRLSVSSFPCHWSAPEPEGRAASLRLPALEGPRRPKPRQSWGPRAACFSK